jgi:hypothetical protein
MRFSWLPALISGRSQATPTKIFMTGLVMLSLSTNACGPSIKEAYERDNAEAKRQCTMESRGRLLAEAARRCNRIYGALNEKYFGPLDSFQQAYQAYMVAVYERVDRRELTQTQASFVLAEFNRRLQVEKKRLGYEESLVQSERIKAEAASRAADA